MVRRKKRDSDFAVRAFRVVQQATGEVEPEPQKPKKDSDAKKLGHLGGLKGGRARADRLTPERRSAIARKAAEKRWKAKT